MLTGDAFEVVDEIPDLAFPVPSHEGFSWEDVLDATVSALALRTLPTSAMS